MYEKKYPGILAFFFFLAFLLQKMVPAIPAQAAGSVGSLYIEPSSGNSAVNQSFSVTVGVNVGTNLNVNVVRFNLSSSNATIEQCTIGSGFQGIAGQSPCRISAASATIIATAVNTVGPSGVVPLATLTVKGNASGLARLLSSNPEIVVNQPDGQSAPFNVTTIETGNYQIGIGTLSPTPINQCASEGSACTWCPACIYGSPPCAMPCVSGICQGGLCQTNTLSPTQPPPCDVPLPKAQGNANDDCVINDGDFAYWMDEYTGTDTTLFADFNGDSKVNLVDYEIWRRNRQ